MLSPLQYQKRIRRLRARSLLVAGEGSRHPRDCWHGRVDCLGQRPEPGARAQRTLALKHDILLRSELSRQE